MRRIVVISSLLSVVLAGGSLFAGDTTSRFEQLKTLAGNWQGTNHEGKSVTVTYEVVSNGSAVMERMQGEGEPDMVTMYHLDGDQLMMTHYCSAMNQPRMRAEASAADNVFAFKMFDITNLAKASDGHMERMVLTIKDADHITHKWTFVSDGEDHEVPLELTRVKMSQK